MIYTMDKWYRYGRGHDFPFYATLEEVSDFMKSLLSTNGDDDNYYICGTYQTKIENSRYYREIGFSYDIGDILTCLKEHSNVINYSIGIEKITPHLNIISYNSEAVLSTNGLILLQYFKHPHYKKLYGQSLLEPMRLGLVSRIYNVPMYEQSEKYEIIEHTTYYELFKKMKRQIKKILPYQTVFHGTNVIDRTCRMSQGIYEQWKSGVLYEHDPLITTIID